MSLRASDPDYDLREIPTAERKIFIHAEELEQLLNSETGATVLDARTRDSALLKHMRPGHGSSIEGRDTAHVVRVYFKYRTGARISPWQDFTDGGELKSVDDIQQLFRDRGVSNDVPVVVFGIWKEGWGEEGRIFWQLDWLNHTQAYILYGGIFAWTETAFTGRGRNGPGDFVARPVPERYASAAEIENLLNNNADVTIVDARAENEYIGDTPYGSSRGGHIPTAMHYRWKWVFDPDNSGNLKPIQNLTREFEDLGAQDTDDDIVIYCTRGIRAAFLYSVFQWAGYENVKNYADSWKSWAQDPNLPVEK